MNLDTLGNPLDLTDEQLQQAIEQRKPGSLLAAAARLSRAEQGESVRERAKSYANVARCLELRGDWSGAAKHWRIAFRTAYRARLFDLIPRYGNHLSFCYHQKGDVAVAICYTSMVLRLLEGNAPEEEVAWAHNHMARCLYDVGHWEAMLYHATEALSKQETPFLKTLARLRAACAMNRLGRYQESSTVAASALQEFKLQNRLDGVLWAKNEVARAQYGLGQYSESLSTAKRARELNENPIIDQPALGRTLALTGMNLKAQGKTKAAYDALRRAATILKAAHAPMDEAEVLQELASLTLRRTIA